MEVHTAFLQNHRWNSHFICCLRVPGPLTNTTRTNKAPFFLPWPSPKSGISSSWMVLYFPEKHLHLKQSQTGKKHSRSL